MASTSFPAIAVKQKNYTFYISALPASRIVSFGKGLRREDFDAFDEQISDDEGRNFVASVEASDFMREAEVIQESSYDQEQPFQRIVDEARIRSIASYLLEENALLPNPVILATRESTVVDVEDIEGAGTNESAKVITLTWDESSPTNIIDGQHRLEAIKRLLKSSELDSSVFAVPFTLCVDLPFYQQAEMFAVINGRQKQVNKSQIYDLLGYMDISDKGLREKAYQGEMAVHRFCHHIVRILNQSKVSPWTERIKMRGSGQGIVTQAAFVDHLAPLVIPRRNSKRLSSVPIFYPFFRDNLSIALAKTLVTYFLGIKRAWETQWKDDPSLKNSLFGKTNGVAVMFMVLHDLVVISGTAEELTAEKTQTYWSRVPKTIIENPPTGGSRSYQREIYKEIMKSMLGENYQRQVDKALEDMRKRLVDVGGLF